MTKAHNIGPIRVRPYRRSQKAKSQWCVDLPRFLEGGKRKRRFFDNCKDAEEFARAVLRAYRNGELMCPGTPIPDDPKFELVVEEWLQYQALRIQTGKKRPISLKTDKYRLRRILPVLGRCAVSEITSERLEAYLAARLAGGVTAETVNSDLRVIRKVFRWGHRVGKVRDIPFIEPVPTERREQYIPEAREVRRIIGFLPERLVPLVTFLAETGCRTGEAFNLTWDRVDFDNQDVLIQGRGSWTPKTQHSNRRIPISAGLSGVLRILPRKSPYVFPGSIPGQPITSIKKAFASAVKKAGIVHRGTRVRITPHTLRKAHATWQAMRNVPECVLQDLLGHAPGSTVTRRHYVHAQEKAKREAVINLKDLDRSENEKRTNLATAVATAQCPVRRAANDIF